MSHAINPEAVSITLTHEGKAGRCATAVESLEEKARAAAAALSSAQLAAVRQHYLGYFASLLHLNCAGTQREIQRQMLHFLADAAADTETDTELAQYLLLACLLHEQQNLPEHLTTAGAACAEAILSKSAALSAGNFLNRQS